MCGITGYRSKDKKDPAILQGSIASIKHRGPDDDDFFLRDTNNGQIGFGHVRLSIIDLSPAGHQPMRYTKELGAFSHTFHADQLIAHSTSAIAIVFNGEIYNFLEIREELLTLGYTFSTQSDTEVILASYLEWGETCVDKLNGMRAFAIYDPPQEKIFLSRDVLGEKPLYYYHHHNQLIRGSELKTILQHGVDKEIDQEAIDFYLTVGYIPAPWSIYKNIKKMPANHNLSFHIPTQHISIYSYYEKPKYEPISNKKLLIQQGKDLIASSTKYRMFADVPVGAFLSGGLDSSTVVAEMTKITKKENLHTFSIGFEGKYDETHYVNIVKNAFGTQHHHSYFTQKEFEERLDDLYYYYDEPFGDYSNFPTSFVSELARQYVTVSLSGDGGDEIFGGYTMHQVAAQMSIFYKLPRILGQLLYYLVPKTADNLSTASKLKEALRVSLLPKEDFYGEIGGSSIPKPAVYKKWAKEKIQELLALNNGNFTQSAIDFDLYYNTLADNFLTKVDRASMRVALEARPPLLDKRLIAYAHTIPTKWKVSRRRTKIIMRDIIQGIVPEEIRTRGKKGFKPPIDLWILQDAYKMHVEKALPVLVDAGILSTSRETFYKEHVFNKSNTIFNNYKIRLLLLMKRYEKRK